MGYSLRLATFVTTSIPYPLLESLFKIGSREGRTSVLPNESAKVRVAL